MFYSEHMVPFPPNKHTYVLGVYREVSLYILFLRVLNVWFIYIECVFIQNVYNSKKL